MVPTRVSTSNQSAHNSEVRSSSAYSKNALDVTMILDEDDGLSVYCNHYLEFWLVVVRYFCGKPYRLRVNGEALQ